MALCNDGGANHELTWVKAERDEKFVGMLRAFRRSGGLARQQQIRDRLSASAHVSNQPHRHIDAIICFEWGQCLWLPWFQFDLRDMSVRAGPAKVVSELSPAFDGWELADWFAQANAWIGNARPVDLIDHGLERVLEAARADRFVALG